VRDPHPARDRERRRSRDDHAGAQHLSAILDEDLYDEDRRPGLRGVQHADDGTVQRAPGYVRSADADPSAVEDAGDL
jgi:hypothetical protein